MTESLSSLSASAYPTYAELFRRIEEADDAACDGMSGHPGVYEECPFCELVVKILRGGDVFCPTCRHINAMGHSCADWKDYDAGKITTAEVDRRAKAREAELLGGSQGNVNMVVTPKEAGS